MLSKLWRIIKHRSHILLLYYSVINLIRKTPRIWSFIPMIFRTRNWLGRQWFLNAVVLFGRTGHHWLQAVHAGYGYSRGEAPGNQPLYQLCVARRISMNSWSECWSITRTIAPPLINQLNSSWFNYGLFRAHVRQCFAALGGGAALKLVNSNYSV